MGGSRTSHMRAEQSMPVSWAFWFQVRGESGKLAGLFVRREFSRNSARALEDRKFQEHRRSSAAIGEYNVALYVRGNPPRAKLRSHAIWQKRKNEMHVFAKSG